MTDPVDPRDTEYNPRLRTSLYGHADVEQRLLSAFKSGRLHHAWLLTGAKGIGKATLAYRFARYILRYPDPDTAPESMAISADDAVFKRVASRGHSDLLTVERSFDDKTKRLKADIGVAEARAMSRFFNRTAGEGGWRICIVDAVDDLNTTAANALLKTLEEPPQRALIILIAQQSAGRLLPTILSRCIKQRLSPLSSQQVAEVLNEIATPAVEGTDLASLCELAQGSPGRAIDLVSTSGARHLTSFQQLVSGRPPYDRTKMLRLADQLASRGEQLGYTAFCDLLREWIMQRASNAALSSSGAAPDQPLLANAAGWAELYRDVDQSIEHANVLNLDRRVVMLEAFRRIEQVEQSRIAT